ncbi:MAG: hypothetical protein HOV68_06860 [Streptomycetaceae bacterium]|nr:hypothetical protein [Streptomycetaceae bacterium]
MRRVAAFTTAAVLAVTGLAACGGDDEKDNTKTDAKALADQALAAMKKLSSINAEGTGADDEGNPTAISVCASPSADALKGTVTQHGEKVDVVAVGGSQSMKGSPQAWVKLDGSEDNPRALPAFKTVLGDNGEKYVQFKSDDQERLIDFFDGDTSGYTKGETVDFHGDKAIPLTKESDKDGEKVKKTYYIAAKGTPYMLGSKEESVSSKEKEEAVFKRTSDKCDVTAPPADKFIDEDAFQKQLKQAAGE